MRFKFKILVCESLIECDNLDTPGALKLLTCQFLHHRIEKYLLDITWP